MTRVASPYSRLLDHQLMCDICGICDRFGTNEIPGKHVGFHLFFSKLQSSFVDVDILNFGGYSLPTLLYRCL